MAKSRFQWMLWIALAAGVACPFSACASGATGDDALPPRPPGDGGDLDSGLSFDGAKGDVASLAIEPPTATIESIDAAAVKQTFKVVATLGDGSSIDVPAATWSATNPQVGTITSGAGSAVFTATGAQGGVVDVNVSARGRTATARLVVKLRLESNAAALDPAAKDALRKASLGDPSTQWAYPYDDTVFPRGLAGPTLMWNGGAKGDVYRVALSSDVFSYETFVTADPPSRLELPKPIWAKFVESTAGSAKLEVMRKTSGGAPTVVTRLGWKIAPASMRGTIYYWSNREGRVLRIKPGASAPDDFSSGVLPTSIDYTHKDASGKDVTEKLTCTMTCHSVSADGSVVISGGDTFGGAYDLGANKPRHDIGGTPGGTRRDWNFAAVTPNGKWVRLFDRSSVI